MVKCQILKVVIKGALINSFRSNSNTLFLRTAITSRLEAFRDGVLTMINDQWCWMEKHFNFVIFEDELYLLV